MWQDFAIASVQLVFLAALGPALVSRCFPPASTCWLTGIGLIILGAIMLTLAAPFSTVVNVFSGLVWVYMALASRTPQEKQHEAND